MFIEPADGTGRLTKANAARDANASLEGWEKIFVKEASVGRKPGEKPQVPSKPGSGKGSGNNQTGGKKR